jgi:hypothetical protein
MSTISDRCSAKHKAAVWLPRSSPGIYRHGVTQAHAGSEVDMDGHIAAVAARLNERATEISTAISTALEENIAELPRDDRMLELLHLGVKDHIKTILHALLHDIGVQQITAPATALEYARGLAQHGVPPRAMMRAYRLGQRRLTELVFAELHALGLDPTNRVAVIEAITKMLLKYVDSVELQALAVYQGERKLVLENQSTARAMRVRNVLADASIDVDTASTAIGYPLRWQHLALIRAPAKVHPRPGEDRRRLGKRAVSGGRPGQRVGLVAVPLTAGRRRHENPRLCPRATGCTQHRDRSYGLRRQRISSITSPSATRADSRACSPPPPRRAGRGD